MQSLAPIALFAFNRPDHIKRTLDALRRCDGFEESHVTVFCDGPRHSAEVEAVKTVRSVVTKCLGHRADYVFRDANHGLSKSIIGGVNDLCARFGKAIVVEDDLEVAKGFLTYMNSALETYSGEEQIFQVSGHMFSVPEFVDRDEALFLPVTATWGWGTWDRAWRQFDSQANGWTAMYADKELRRRFNLGGVYDYFTMLERQMSGRRDSWGIRWYWSVFRRGGLGCFPPQSMVRNRGMDGSGTHGRGVVRGFDRGIRLSERQHVKLPTSVGVDPNLYRMVRRAIWRDNGGWLGYVADRAKGVAGKLRRRA